MKHHRRQLTKRREGNNETVRTCLNIDVVLQQCRGTRSCLSTVVTTHVCKTIRVGSTQSLTPVVQGNIHIGCVTTEVVLCLQLMLMFVVASSIWLRWVVHLGDAWRWGRSLKGSSEERGVSFPRIINSIFNCFDRSKSNNTLLQGELFL